MNRRILLATALAGTLALGAAVAPAASASNVAWSVSIGGPGVAVSAGAPGYWGPGYRPYYNGYRPYYRPAYVAPPVYAYPAPVYYTPYAYARPVVVAPRPVYRSPYYAPYRY
jgi:hypothetical protein